jgi:hypothetical protein
MQFAMNVSMLSKSSGLMLGLIDIYKKSQNSIKNYSNMMSMSQSLPIKLIKVFILIFVFFFLNCNIKLYNSGHSKFPDVGVREDSS